jgi:hypothetical protein
LKTKKRALIPGFFRGYFLYITELADEGCRLSASKDVLMAQIGRFVLNYGIFKSIMTLLNLHRRGQTPVIRMAANETIWHCQ